MGRLKAFKFKSIRTILVVPFAISFILATALIAALVLNDSRKGVNKVLNELRHTMISLVENDLDNKLNQAIQLNQIHKDAFESAIINIESVEQRERYFSIMLKNYTEVSMTYIGLPDGQFYGARRNIDGTIDVVRNNLGTQGNSEYYRTNRYGEGTELVQVFENFDPRKRPWFLKAVETKNMTFSSIYNHFVFKEPTVTASFPIYEEEKLIGVFGVDYLMTWLGDTLKKLPIGEHGQVFIVDEKKQLVATTTSESIFKIVDNQSVNILATESTNLVTKKIIEMKQNNQTLPSVTIDEKNYLYGVDTYEKYGIKWSIYTVIERSDFLQEVNKTKIKARQTIIGLSILFIIVVFMLTKQIVRPIILLKEMAKKLSEGVFVEVEINGRSDELSQLTQSFNDMGKQLTGLVYNLEKEVALRTVELEEKNNILNNLSYIDGLSQIANRRKFDEYIEQILELSPNNGRSLGLIMLDIDYFKLFNDSYGHIAGDECIKTIATVLDNCIKRNSDLAARYGGEEFVVVVQDFSLEGMQKIAETIRYRIQELNIKHDQTEIGSVTVSLGVVYGKGIALSAKGLVQRADEALYRAKNNGRNSIEFEEI